ncbi:MAG: type IX secretion system outer membrane channel protein PorV, partial [Bacteroidales bacterium]|nr:type IX secretion system outer membrane channel protein PorV [Bacteroidales bacterium]
MNLLKPSILVLCCVIVVDIFAQQYDLGVINNTAAPNPIRTAVPFMTIAPDSRSSSMADVGVATSPDINSQHWNPAKYAFIDQKGGISLSYSPWLRALVDDMNLLYLTGFWGIDKMQTVSASLRYFDMGSIQFTDYSGQSLLTGKPNEFAFDVGYSRKFSEKMSVAIAFRYIRSDISSGVPSIAGTKAKAGSSFAGDLAMYYRSNIELGKRKGTWAVGANFSNLGTKMTYANEQEKMFIPMNMCIGGSFGISFDDYNKITLAVDLNKLLVPTPPIEIDGVVKGKKDDVSVTKGIFQSFIDAPGGGAEELHEIAVGTGLEYTYRSFFAIRTGYHHENRLKGNRRYFTMGVGVMLNVFEVDFSYLISPYGNRDPLANTLRFSLIFNLGASSSSV